MAFLRKDLFDYNSRLLASFQEAKAGTQSTTLIVTSKGRTNTCPFASLFTHTVQGSAHEINAAAHSWCVFSFLDETDGLIGWPDLGSSG